MIEVHTDSLTIKLNTQSDRTVLKKYLEYAKDNMPSQVSGETAQIVELINSILNAPSDD